MTATVRTATRRPVYVCSSCRHKQLQVQRRAVSTSFLIKMKEGREQWAEWAKEIKQKKRMSPLNVLKSRGFVHDIVGSEKDLDKLMIDKRIGVYCGIDPTAPSLHIGHMIPFMALFWMYVSGFHAVSLIGGGTASVGDPTGRTTDRRDLSTTERKSNIVAMHYQLKRLWLNLERTAERHGFLYEKYWHRELVNNSTWWQGLPLLDVLRALGPGLRMGDMLRKDTVKTKMNSPAGMSFAEFCYPILQSWDWWQMYDRKDIQVQIGGQDQFGNLAAGVDAIKYIAKNHEDPNVRQVKGVVPLTTPYGFTTPLLTTSSGEKLGKSGGNAIWLNENMTPIFDQFAYFMKTSDADVERFLKFFTFLSLDNIKMVMEEHAKDSSKRTAQRTLAYEFMHLVHGPKNADEARDKYDRMSNARRETTLTGLLGEARASANESDAPSSAEEDAIPSDIQTGDLTPEKVGQNPWTGHSFVPQAAKSTYISQKLNKYAPPSNPNTNAKTDHIVLPRSLVYGRSIGRVFHAAGLVSSRSEGHRLASQKGAYVGRKDGKDETMSDDIVFRPTYQFHADTIDKYVIKDADPMRGPGEEGTLILRSGKWRVRIIRVVSNEKFETMGLPDPPGYAEYKSEELAARTKESMEGLDRRSGYTLQEREQAERERVIEQSAVAAREQVLATAIKEERETSAPRPNRRTREHNAYVQEKAAMAYLQARADAESRLQREEQAAQEEKEKAYEAEHGVAHLEKGASRRIRWHHQDETRAATADPGSSDEAIDSSHPSDEAFEAVELSMSDERDGEAGDERNGGGRQDALEDEERSAFNGDHPGVRHAEPAQSAGGADKYEEPTKFSEDHPGVEHANSVNEPFGIQHDNSPAVQDEWPVRPETGEQTPSRASTSDTEAEPPVFPSEESPASQALASSTPPANPHDQPAASTADPSQPPNHTIFPWETSAQPRPRKAKQWAAHLKQMSDAEKARRRMVVAELRARGDSPADIERQVQGSRHIAQQHERREHEQLRRAWLRTKTRPHGRNLPSLKRAPAPPPHAPSVPEAREMERRFVEWKRQETSEAKAANLQAQRRRREHVRERRLVRDWGRRYDAAHRDGEAGFQ